MNNNVFKTVAYILLSILIIMGVVKFFLWMLPYLLVIGLVSYIIYKSKKFTQNKKNMNGKYDGFTNYEHKDNSQKTEKFSGNVIDVDYEEIKK